MAEYKPHSHKYREENNNDEKNIQPVVKGNITVKKDTISKKFSDTFLADNMQNVTSYIVSDVIVPAVIDTIVDAISSGVNMLFKGSPAPRKSRSNPGRTNYTTFSRVSSEKDSKIYSRDRYGLLDIVFESRGDALEVRDCLYEIFDKYHVVSVSEYYDLSKASDQARYTDRSYGWDDLPEEIQVTRDRDGYRLKLPRPEPI